MGGLAMNASVATTNIILSHLRLQSQNQKVCVAVLPVETKLLSKHGSRRDCCRSPIVVIHDVHVGLGDENRQLLSERSPIRVVVALVHVSSEIRRYHSEFGINFPLDFRGFVRAPQKLAVHYNPREVTEDDRRFTVVFTNSFPKRKRTFS